jgi:hypothetical protein
MGAAVEVLAAVSARQHRGREMIPFPPDMVSPVLPVEGDLMPLGSCHAEMDRHSL